MPRGPFQESTFRLKLFFFFSSRRRHTRLTCDWSSDVCSSDLVSFDVTMRVPGHEETRQLTTMARVVRGKVLTLRELDFVQAARALGAGPGRILLRHLLPRSEERRVGKECRSRGAAYH